ncbi:MAG: hypothetical protein KC925_03440 [Candidatus Doudnabacteria bacterium]|nr:hypothetical protein [Candidatus Doudnabacteria bacterium]MCA9387926.1 hypothetical protein [Candidatus Andersenbacteria bacterium]
MTFLQRATSRTGLAVLALVCAIGLWIFVINDGFRAGFLDRNLEIQASNVQEGLALSEALPDVSVQVKAPADLWAEFPDDELSASVDLEGLGIGTHEVPVEISVRNPRIIVLERTPEFVQVRIDQVTTIEKEVDVEVSGNVAEGFVTKDPEKAIDRVELRGASGALSRVARILATVTLQGEEEEVRHLAPLVALDSNNNPVEGILVNPGTVEIRIPVEREQTVNTVRIEPRTSGTLPSGFTLTGVSTNPSTIELEGTQEALAAIDVVPTQAIALENVRESYEREVTLELPEGVTVKDDRRVIMRIEIAQQQATRSIVANIETKDVPNGLEITSLSPSSAALTVAGNKLTVDGLDPAGVRIVLSLTGKVAGTYDLPIAATDVQLPGGVTLSSVDTRSVRVVLEQK